MLCEVRIIVSRLLRPRTIFLFTTTAQLPDLGLHSTDLTTRLQVLERVDRLLHEGGYGVVVRWYWGDVQGLLVSVLWLEGPSRQHRRHIIPGTEPPLLPPAALTSGPRNQQTESITYYTLYYTLIQIYRLGTLVWVQANFILMPLNTTALLSLRAFYHSILIFWYLNKTAWICIITSCL